MAGALSRLAAQFSAGALPRAPYDMTSFDAGTALAKIDNFYRHVISTTGNIRS
jgi:hypothetical protein